MIRALDVEKCQLALVWLALRSCSQVAISSTRVCLSAGGMIGLLYFVLAVLASPFKSKIRLEAENAVLRHQLTVLLRRLRGHVRLTNNDRCFFVLLYRRFPSILQVLTIIRLETLMRWHRSGFRCY